MKDKEIEFEVGDRVLVHKLDLICKEPSPVQKGIIIKKEDKYTDGWNGTYYTIWGVEEKKKICITNGEGIELDLEQ